MKRLSNKHKKYLLKRKQKIEIRRFRSSRSYNKKIDLVRHHNICGPALSPPKNMCLDEDFEGVLRFIEKLRGGLTPTERRRKKRKKGPPRRGGSVRTAGHVPFEEIDNITPAAALLMAAEYDRYRRMQRRPLYPIRRENWKPWVDAMLSEIGFLRLLEIEGLPSVTLGDDHSRYRTLPMVSGNRTDGREVGLFQDSIAELLADNLGVEVSLRLYDGLIEAMNNVVQHAYPVGYSCPRPIRNRWWLTGSFNPSTGRLHIVFLDQGVTIPVALPRSEWREWALDFLGRMYNILALGRGRPDDAERIHAAMEVGRSGSDDQGRGHGLAQMLDFVKMASDGRLRILSRRGQFMYEKGQSRPHLRNLSSPVRGTLIEWECCVKTGGGREL